MAPLLIISGLTFSASNTLIGFLLAMLSAVFNGTYSVLAKAGFKPPDVDDTIFNLWACLGLSTTGMVLAVLSGPLVWEPLGLISGLLLSSSIAWAFLTVDFVGASVGTGVKNGMEALMSFCFGLFLDPDGGNIRNLPLALVGLAFLLASMAGIAYAGRPSSSEGDEETGLLGYKKHGSNKAFWHFAAGLSFSLLAGASGGLVLAPMQFVPKSARGIAFFPSLISGALIGAPLVAILPHLYRQEPIQLKAKTAALPGIAAGVCWNGSTVFKMLAIGYLGYGLAYPIVQSSLFVAGLWGILMFDEMKGKRNRTIFWASGAVCVTGATLLTFSK